LGSWGDSPYTADDDAYTSFFTPAKRAASSKFKVPSMFMQFAVNGLAIDLGTDGRAA
jgi:hypothetical protein